MDMLIRLNIGAINPRMVEKLGRKGVVIRRAMAYERSQVIDWVHEYFNSRWADECAVAFGRQPIGCHIAIKKDGIKGFCCVDTTFQNFIGPIGVRQSLRRQGVGNGLLVSVAQELLLSGYTYAVVGDVGQPEFFKKAVGAWEIPDSTPGAYPRKII
jgi:GNAT superfamily N-acetyltransferase